MMIYVLLTWVGGASMLISSSVTVSAFAPQFTPALTSTSCRTRLELSSRSLFSLPGGGERETTSSNNQHHSDTENERRSDMMTMMMQFPSVAAIRGMVASGCFFCLLSASQVAMASEIGVEVEAPTIVTGETVEICTKRGILGACLQTELRTAVNDNDISQKYFKQPSELVQQRKWEAALASENDEGNALIQKLRQQSVDNAEQNNLLVQRKTFENDQSAVFGPFDRQVLIMNVDGKTFTMLQNPQAMRLKKAGFINDRRQFIQQPTPEEIDQALEPEQGSGGFLSGILGGGN